MSLGIDEIRHRLCLRKIDLVIQKGALGKFARPSRTASEFEKPSQNEIEKDRVSVGVKLENRLPRKGLRALEVEGYALIEAFAGCGPKGRKEGLPWGGFFTQ
jgi:hypothetical protein